MYHFHKNKGINGNHEYMHPLFRKDSLNNLGAIKRKLTISHKAGKLKTSNKKKDSENYEKLKEELKETCKSLRKCEKLNKKITRSNHKLYNMVKKDRYRQNLTMSKLVLILCSKFNTNNNIEFIEELENYEIKNLINYLKTRVNYDKKLIDNKDINESDKCNICPQLYEKLLDVLYKNMTSENCGKNGGDQLSLAAAFKKDNTTSLTCNRPIFQDLNAELSDLDSKCDYKLDPMLLDNEDNSENSYKDNYELFKMENNPFNIDSSTISMDERETNFEDLEMI